MGDRAGRVQGRRVRPTLIVADPPPTMVPMRRLAGIYAPMAGVALVVLVADRAHQAVGRRPRSLPDHAGAAHDRVLPGVQRGHGVQRRLGLGRAHRRRRGRHRHRAGVCRPQGAAHAPPAHGRRRRRCAGQRHRPGVPAAGAVATARSRRSLHGRRRRRLHLYAVLGRSSTWPTACIVVGGILLADRARGGCPIPTPRRRPGVGDADLESTCCRRRSPRRARLREP